MMKWGYLLFLYLLEKYIVHKISNSEVPLSLLHLAVAMSEYRKEYDTS